VAALTFGATRRRLKLLSTAGGGRGSKCFAFGDESV
jgi:hypothetical protein